MGCKLLTIASAIMVGLSVVGVIITGVFSLNAPHGIWVLLGLLGLVGMVVSRIVEAIISKKE